MRWDSMYEVGIVTIDSQHKRLVEMIAELEDAVSGTDRMTEHTGNILKKLVDYVKNHFHDEEQIMMKMLYPDLQAHKRHHKELVNEVREILLILKNGGYISNSALLEFLKKWLSEHILMEDKKIGQYLLQGA